jgi:jacalin-like lectin domain-containing protein
MHAWSKVSRNGGTIMGKYGSSGGGGGGENPGFSMAVDEEIGEVVVHILHRPGGSNEVIVAIEFVSRQGQIHRFGGDRDADERISFHLDPGDVISKITGLAGDHPIHIRVWLQSGRVSDPLGDALGTAVRPFEYDGGSQQIVGLWGRTGAWIDAIGVYSE